MNQTSGSIRKHGNISCEPNIHSDWNKCFASNCNSFDVVLVTQSNMSHGAKFEEPVRVELWLNDTQSYVVCGKVIYMSEFGGLHKQLPI